jgi:site-specific DNA recombinase
VSGTAKYRRISEDRESEEAGVTRQNEDLDDLAERHGLTVVADYSDNDLGASAKSRKPRPGYQRLIADAKAGKFGTIIAYSSSRLTRRPLELEGQIELAEKYGVRFVYVKSPSFDLNTADGRQVARMLAAADAAEAERTGERVQRAAQQRAENGGHHGGQRGYGFTPTGEVVPAERDVIRDMAGRLLAGVSLRQVAGDLNARGVPTTTGKGRWSGALVRDVVSKPRAAGLTVHDGAIVGTLPGEPILSRDTWEAVCGKLATPTRRSNTGRPAVWLLSGIARCVCGAPLDAGPREAYRCGSLRSGPGGGGHVRRSAPALDDFVSAIVIETLSLPDAIELFAKPAGPKVDLPALRREASALRERKTALAAAYGVGDLDDIEYAAAKRANQAKLDEIEASLAAAVDTSPLAPLLGVDDVEEAWSRLSLGQQRRVVDRLMVVTVLPVTRRGRGFDEDAIRIDWRTS